jgi:hypothetical protein
LPDAAFVLILDRLCHGSLEIDDPIGFVHLEPRSALQKDLTEVKDVGRDWPECHLGDVCFKLNGRPQRCHFHAGQDFRIGGWADRLHSLVGELQIDGVVRLGCDFLLQY